jgi:hypothetical protein
MYTEPLVVHVGCDAIIQRRKNIFFFRLHVRVLKKMNYSITWPHNNNAKIYNSYTIECLNRKIKV